MKYGTTMEMKWLVPYSKGLFLSQKLSDIASTRLKWIDYIRNGNSILKASRHFDIPESTIRYWMKRFNPKDLKTLENKSRKPKQVRQTKIPFSVVDKVIELRQKHKGWGKIKIQILLKRIGISVGQTRIQKIINMTGLKRIPHAKKKYTKHVNRRHMYSVPKEMLKIPGGLVYVDVKHLSLLPNLKVYQFTAIDHATKILKIKVFSNITSRCGKMFLDYITQSEPFKNIKYLGSDNGSENMGELDKELQRRGIQHAFSSPRSPKQNPFVERVIRTTIDEVYSYYGTELNITKQQERLDEFVYNYNEVRPHHSLKLNTPMEQFAILNSSHSNS